MLQSVAFSAVLGYYYYNVETLYEGKNMCLVATNKDDITNKRAENFVN